jgi:hypothetical protein
LQPDLDQNKVLDLVEKARIKIDHFCKAEDRIFNSCGMSIRFKVALSAAARKSKRALSTARYKKIDFEDLDNLKASSMKEKIRDIKSISYLFDGGNPINFNRNGKYFKSIDLAHEISCILNNYRLRFFAIDFERDEK